MAEAPAAREATLPSAPLPSNPNCVAFSAEAAAVSGRRPWADLVRLALGPALALHHHSGLPVLAGWSWRVALDRKNRRSVQLVLWFAFDGPATSSHLDALEQAVHAAIPGASSAGIERCPVNGANAVLVRDGRAAVPWLLPEDDDEPQLLVIEWEGSRLRPRVIRRTEATDALVPKELPGVIGVAPPYGPEEQEHERMRLAFAMHFCDRVVRADGVVHADEAEFVANVFPPDLVKRLGLDAEGTRAEHLRAALEVLPQRLGHHDKLGLVGLLFSACYSDGTLDAREMRVLKDAGEALGLTKEHVVKYLRRFW